MAIGDIITAARYNNLQSRVETILGTGSGDDGYGQALNSSQVGASTTITASHMSTLYTDIANGRVHQTGTAPTEIAIIGTGTTILDTDVIAPSDMMDGRVLCIRNILEKNGFHNTAIMSYTAKYASSFYGPFREALDSKPGFGDKKTYQMDFCNRFDAVSEAKLDINEGADIIMVKPGISYLDIVRDLKNTIDSPIAIYQVSGEYSMLKAASKQGWLDHDKVMMEQLISMKRAGASMIASYFAKDAIKLIS